MKRFSLLRIFVDVVELIAYLELFGGMILIILLSFKVDINILPVVGGLGTFIVLWIVITIPTLVYTHLIRLALAYYETSYASLEVSRDILRELKSNSSGQNSLKELEFKTWKLNNPDKSLNDYYLEKNN